MNKDETLRKLRSDLGAAREGVIAAVMRRNKLKDEVDRLEHLISDLETKASLADKMSNSMLAIELREERSSRQTELAKLNPALKEAEHAAEQAKINLPEEEARIRTLIGDIESGAIVDFANALSNPQSSAQPVNEAESLFQRAVEKTQHLQHEAEARRDVTPHDPVAAQPEPPQSQKPALSLHDFGAEEKPSSLAEQPSPFAETGGSFFDPPPHPIQPVQLIETMPASAAADTKSNADPAPTAPAVKTPEEMLRELEARLNLVQSQIPETKAETEPAPLAFQSNYLELDPPPTASVIQEPVATPSPVAKSTLADLAAAPISSALPEPVHIAPVAASTPSTVTAEASTHSLTNGAASAAETVPASTPPKPAGRQIYMPTNMMLLNTNPTVAPKPKQNAKPVELASATPASMPVEAPKPVDARASEPISASPEAAVAAALAEVEAVSPRVVDVPKQEVEASMRETLLRQAAPVAPTPEPPVVLFSEPAKSEAVKEAAAAPVAASTTPIIEVEAPVVPQATSAPGAETLTAIVEMEAPVVEAPLTVAPTAEVPKAVEPGVEAKAPVASTPVSETVAPVKVAGPEVAAPETVAEPVHEELKLAEPAPFVAPSKPTEKQVKSMPQSAPMTERVRLAAIGTGGIWRGAHAPAYVEIPQMRLTAIVDPDKTAQNLAVKRYEELVAKKVAQLKDRGDSVGADNLQRDLDSLKVYEDIRQVIEGGDADLVDVCTQPMLHAPLSIQALEAGLNVMCEKPLSRSWLESKRLIETVKRTGKLYQHNENWLWERDYYTAKKLIDAGAIGEAVFMYLAQAHGGPEGNPNFWNPDFGGGGALLDNGIHAIGAAWFLTGLEKKPTYVKAADPYGMSIRMPQRILGSRFQKITVDDDAHILIRFEDEQTMSWSTAHVEGSWSHQDSPDTAIFGTTGKIQFLEEGGKRYAAVYDIHSRETRRVEVSGPTWSHWPSSHYGEILNAVELVRNGINESICTAEFGADCSAIVGASYLSEKRDRKAIHVNDFKKFAEEIEVRYPNDPKSADDALVDELLSAVRK